MKVSRLPKDPGPAAWNSILPQQAPPQVLSEDLRADYLVIGAGFAGLSAARRLSQLDDTARIVVLDATRLAHGPAGRNSGFMIDLPHDLASDDYGGAPDHDRVLTADNRHAIDFAAEMAKDFGLSPEAFTRSGKVNGAASSNGQQHNEDYARHLTQLDEPHEMLDAAAMLALTGTDYYQGGLFTPGTAMIQPAMYIRGIAEGMASNRLQIFENSPVTALEHNGDWVATTPRGRVTAPKVILAVNGHLNSFGLMQNQLMHVFTYGSMTRPLTDAEAAALGGAPNWGLTPADPLGTTVRKISGTGGTRLIIRNRATFDPSLAVSDARIATVGRTHDASFATRFPMLRDVTMDYRWGGRLCLSRNNVNVLGEAERGLFLAACQNGLGTTRGTLMGLLAAELATGQSSDRLDRALAVAQPTKMLPSWITAPAANIYLRWGERKAGAEL